jgi:hypothetical protein
MHQLPDKPMVFEISHRWGMDDHLVLDDDRSGKNVALHDKRTHDYTISEGRQECLS